MFGFSNRRQNTNQYQQPQFGGQQTNGGGQQQYGGNPQFMQQQPNQPGQPNPGQNQQTEQNKPNQLGGNNPDLEAYVQQRAAEIDMQVQEFSRKNPNFDMKTEIQNPEFCNYVWGNGLSVEDAYILAHKNEFGMNGKSQFQNQNSAPQKRVSENGTGRCTGQGMVKKNPKDLSDDEVDDIVKRVRNGEKISF